MLKTAFRRSLLAAALVLTPLAAQAAEKPKVVASFSILGDLVHQIAGDDVDLTVLVGPDGDAHTYEPTPADAKALGAADVVVVNGLGLEGFMPRLLSASGFKGREIVASEGVTPRLFTPEEAAHEEAEEAEAGHDHADHDHDHDHDAAHAGHDHGPQDPHAWQSLSNGVIYARNILAGLSAADPDHAAEYKTRADALIATMETLDKTLKAEFAAIPEERRRIVTSHDAFGYFGQAYGIEFIAPQGMSTESEASAADVAAIVRQIRDEHISALFVENITDPRLIEQIARETGLKAGGELFSDALSPPSGPAATYIAMFENNSKKLLAALAATN
ncbi:metal ABC transporter substrate-binding protein [Prosthecomicrobium pneumaticum]|uniref:Zinc/manganese transport system substrate-binding protein n=1 Tax=Prosthecomicrobium pneumaticum TaxID=81895 RepID=A0A7W9FLD6_9HYPH|nr:metal ABC transporter substrate-binding protein [Prosthecomicrobium pneumaticum]MBB5752802.1 zinc/manganese transport system substrate-binding protein [Prosthecomicrobium pneumaticum]